MKVYFKNKLLLGKWARMCLLVSIVGYSFAGFAINYTWQGALNSDWNNPANWSPNGVPTFADNVSFPTYISGSFHPFINVHAVCNNFTGTGGGAYNLSGNANLTLTVFGDFNYGQVSWSFLGDIHLEAINKTVDITSAGVNLNNNIYIDGPLGVWNVTDGLFTSGILFLKTGTLNVNGVSMGVGWLYSNYPTVRALDYSSGTVNLSEAYSYPYHSWEDNNTLAIYSDASSVLSFTPSLGGHVSYVSNGHTYNGNVRIDNQASSATMYGSNTFDILELKTDVHITDDNTIDQLFLDPGFIYTISAGKTQTVNTSWNATGTCNAFITLKSTHSCQDAYIDFLGTPNPSTVQLYFLIIEDVISSGTSIDWGSGGYVPSMVDNIYNMSGDFPDWPNTTVGSSTLTWIGGNGNWSNPSNWSSSCVPDPLTTVVFNAPGSVCTLDISNAVCASMDWQSGVTSGGVFASTSSANDLTIYGSLTAQSTAAMTWGFNGSTHFKSHTTGNTIDMSVTNTQNFDGPVYFEGCGGGWDMASDFISNNDVFVHAGDFSTDDGSGPYDMSIRGFYSDIVNTRSIDITGSVITCINGWDIYSVLVGGGNDVTLNSGSGPTTTGSTIIITSGHFQSSGDFGYTYGNLDLNNSNGTQYLFGANTFDGYVTFLGNGYMPSANVIGASAGDLTFSAGKSYTLGAAQTLSTSSDLIALGSCSLGYIYIKNGSFLKTSGTSPQVVDYCVIKNNTASTVTFNATNSIGIGTTTGWSITNPYNGPLYFQANSNNNWNTGTNWYVDPSYSTLSSPPCPPNPLNDVYFSDNGSSHSFSLVGTPEVELNVSNAFCKGMYWGDNSGSGGWGQHTGSYGSVLNDVPSNPKVDEAVSNGVLHVFGEMMLQNTMDWDYSGQVMFEADAPASYRIKAQTEIFQNEVTFDGYATSAVITNQAEWKLESNFEIFTGSVGVSVDKGTLSTNGFMLRAGHTYSTGTQFRGLNISGSSIELRTSGNTAVGNSYAWYTSGSNLNLNTPSSDISIDNTTMGGIARLYAEGPVVFNDITFELNCNAEIYGSGTGTNARTFHDATFLGNGNFYCDNTYNGDLFFNPGYLYTLTSGTDQFITNTGDLLASGTVSQTVFIKPSIYGPGNEASITKDGGIICINYASIRDNDAVSVNGAQFFDGPNGFNVDNNTGWAFTGCSAPNLYGCAGTALSFSTQGTYTGATYLWDFGDGSGTSTVSAPSYAYTATNVYNVTVTVTVGTTQYLEYFTANIATSCCQEASDPNYTNISGTISTDVVWPSKVYVSADVVVTSGAVLEIANSDVVLADNVIILVEDNSHLESVNSTFRPCNPAETWAGIELDEDATGSFNENVFIAAEAGLAIGTDGIVKASNNQFTNCEKGIYLTVEIDNTMEHVITGNSFILNEDNNFAIPSSIESFFGIQISGLSVTGVISQNDFAYTSSVQVDDLIYGIHNNSGEIVASENNFTNVTYAYYQNGTTGINSFENNEIDFNQSIVGLYHDGTSLVEVVGITISGSPSATYLGSNVITMPYQTGQISRGIYSEGLGTVSHGNKISGLEFGIHYDQCDGEISRNEVVHSDRGIYVSDNLGQVDVIDNEVSASRVTGILLAQCPEDIAVRRNTVKNDPLSTNTVGIEYILNGSTPTNNADFRDNCVFDSEYAMYFEDQATNCYSIPDISGNYMFNYASAGIYIDGFSGNIPFVGTTSRNSFVPNPVAGTPWDVQEVNGTCGAILIAGYWPMTINMVGNVVNGGTGPNDNSYATCGNQALKEGDLPAFQAYITDLYSLDYADEVYTLKTAFVNSIANLDQEKRAGYAKSMYGILASNEDMQQAEVLISALESSHLLAEDDLRWIKYYNEAKTGNFEQASQYLNEITAEDKDEADLLFTEKVRLTLSKNHSDLRSLSTQDSVALKAIDDQKGAHAAIARDMIHVAKSGHPFIYNMDLPNRNPVAGAANVKLTEVGTMQVYPNPTQDDFMVLFNVESLNNAELTVTNMLGVQLIYQQVIGNTRKLQLNVSDLPAGLYTVSLFNNDALLDAVQLVKH